MGTLSLVWKLATGPIWVLWSGYKGLWWVFGDTHAPVPKAQRQASGAEGNPTQRPGADQTASFEVVDSRPAKPPLPTRALRAGFVGTLLGSGGMFIAFNALSAVHALTPERGIAAWLWGSAMMAVLSIFAVRRVARLDRERRGLRDFFRGAGNRAVGACSWAAGRAARGAAGAARAGCRWGRWGAGQAADMNSRHNMPGRMKETVTSAAGAAKRAWGSIGRATPADPKTAA